jgi:ATP/maltotriose-dependent transcriptional regulator MalT
MSMIQEAATSELFVGRTKELAGLRRDLAALRSGQGKLTLLAGPAGYGKTSLVKVLAEQASSAGFRVRWGRSSETGDTPPYWPWVQVIRSITRGADRTFLERGLGAGLSGLALLAPEIQQDIGVDPPDALTDAAGARFRAFAAVADLLRLVAAEQDGALIILEDLHWADAPTLRLLDYLSAEIAEAPILVLGTYRSEDQRPEFERMLPSLRRAAGTNEMRLGPLSLSEVDEFLRAVLGEPAGELSRAVHERTEGHPLFLVEVARILSEEPAGEYGALLPSVVPESVRETVGHRLGKLTPECRSMLEAASVLGHPISLRRLQSVAADVSAPLLTLVDEAKTASLLVPLAGKSEEFQFEHGLFREALYDGLPLARRVKLHRAAAEALEAEPNPEAHAVDLAHHWLQVAASGDTGHAERWVLQAADAAAANLAFEAAVPLYCTALELAENRGADSVELANRLLALGTAQWRAGELHACLESTCRAAALAEHAGRPDLVARAALVMHGVGDERIIHAVIRLCRQALALLGPGNERLRAAVMGRLALAVSESGDVDMALTLSARALELAGPYDDPEVLVPALQGRQRSLFLPQWSQERLILAARMLALASVSDRPDLELWGHAWRAAVMFEHGDAPGITSELKELRRVAAFSNDPLSRFHLLKHEAAWQHITGRFAEARQSWETALSLALRIDDMSAVGPYLGFVTMLARETGDYDGHRRTLEVMRVDSSNMPPVMTTLLALLKLDEGATDEARVDYERLRPLYPVEQGSPGWLMTTSFFGELAAAFGDREVAASVYSTLLPFGDHFESCGSGVVFCYSPVSYYLGLLAQSLDKPDEARTQLQSAVEFCHRVGAPGIAARAKYALAQLIRRDDPRDASALAASASATAEVLGMLPLHTRAKALVEELRPAATAAVPLSRRECEVAGLVAQGLSNRGIAEALVVSPRTVESHVQSILTKLNFGSRSQVAAWATTNGLGRS